MSLPPIPEPPEALQAVQNGETGFVAEPLSLEMLESLACGNNPTLIQAKSQVDATFGEAIQAGLWPNPTVGYLQEQIGVEDTAGEFAGGFIEQKIITADKLKLSREKYLERTKVAQWLAMVQEYRVLNDIRLHYFRTLGRQQLVEIHKELVKTAEDQLVTTREMYNLGQANQADVHQANAMLQQERLHLLTAENNFREAFVTLSSLVGVELANAPLNGSLTCERGMIEWDAALARLLAESPELQAAHAKLRADQITVRREEVQPIPNIVVRGSTGYNFEPSARQTVGGVSAFIEVPLFDRNQGTVQQAQADLVRQHSEIRRTELLLQRRLAETYKQYLTAFQHVENYEQVVLPESKQALKILLDSYEADRVAWPTVLNAQREYNQRRAEYVASLIRWRESEVLINGYLLHGGLETPMDVTPPGHLDAVPKPR